MNRIMLMAAALALLHWGSAAANAADMGKHGKMNMNHGMDEMLAPLKGLSGNEFDRAFYSMMIPHHQGAVEMSQKIMGITRTEKIKHWAKNIVDGQEREIADMKAALDKIGGTERKYYDMMDSDMKHMVEMTTDDRNYIEMMIPHHESAVKMAEMAKGRTENAELLSMADKIIQAQRKEIGEFEDWLKDLKNN